MRDNTGIPERKHVCKMAQAVEALTQLHYESKTGHMNRPSVHLADGSLYKTRVRPQWKTY